MPGRRRSLPPGAFEAPQGLAIDAEGRLVLVDRTNDRVRRITGIRW
ncbi:MAG: hypothetical protein KIT58_13545 [Planctomycetota bacterium]|nr:hypothetical protein [Planctomycetota bacterium]